jgi:hypothetical protein
LLLVGLLQVWTEESGKNRGYCKWKYVGCDKAGEVVEMVSHSAACYDEVLAAACLQAHLQDCSSSSRYWKYDGCDKTGEVVEMASSSNVVTQQQQQRTHQQMQKQW